MFLSSIFEALNNCKTVSSATAVFQSLKKMQSSATNHRKYTDT
jgi:hypothetical protein